MVIIRNYFRLEYLFFLDNCNKFYWYVWEIFSSCKNFQVYVQNFFVWKMFFLASIRNFWVNFSLMGGPGECGKYKTFFVKNFLSWGGDRFFQKGKISFFVWKIGCFGGKYKKFLGRNFFFGWSALSNERDKLLFLKN